VTSSETAGALKRFRRTPWRFQATFHTPLRDLSNFVATILLTNESIQEACLTSDRIVFEPKKVNALLEANSLPDLQKHDWSVTANGRREITDLLEAALEDWIDFIFVPTPKPFVIYADHDEYTTFYANTKSNLNLIAEALAARGYKQVENYLRTL